MILVDIYIPSLDDSFDFMLDEDTSVDKIILEISEMISKKVNGVNAEEINELFLYNVETKQRLENGKTLCACGVKDGCRLMLV
jgi:hypothetical protein